MARERIIENQEESNSQTPHASSETSDQHHLADQNLMAAHRNDSEGPRAAHNSDHTADNDDYDSDADQNLTAAHLNDSERPRAAHNGDHTADDDDYDGDADGGRGLNTREQVRLMNVICSPRLKIQKASESAPAAQKIMWYEVANVLGGSNIRNPQWAHNDKTQSNSNTRPPSPLTNVENDPHPPKKRKKSSKVHILISGCLTQSTKRNA